MADLQKYYQDMREKRAELTKDNDSGFCLVISLYNRDKGSTAGSVCEVSIKDAARVIVDGTHRVATAEEAEAFKQSQESNRAAIAKAELDRARKQFSQLMGVDPRDFAPAPSRKAKD